MSKANTNTTSAAHARMLDHQQKALRYRRGGSSYSAIAAELGITKQRAHQLVQAALVQTVRENAGDGADLRALEIERLDVAIRAIADKVQAGDLPAIDRWLRISERRAHLLGLDAPTNINHFFIQQQAADVAARTGMPLAQAEAEIRKVLAEAHA